jgi:hypothetical protein
MVNFLTEQDREKLQNQKFPSFNTGLALFLLISFIILLLLSLGYFSGLLDKIDAFYLSIGLIVMYLIIRYLLNFRIMLDLKYNRKSTRDIKSKKTYKTRVGAGKGVSGTITYFVKFDNYKPLEISKDLFNKINHSNEHIKIEVAPTSRIVLKVLILDKNGKN